MLLGQLLRSVIKTLQEAVKKVLRDRLSFILQCVSTRTCNLGHTLPIQYDSNSNRIAYSANKCDVTLSTLYTVNDTVFATNTLSTQLSSSREFSSYKHTCNELVHARLKRHPRNTVGLPVQICTGMVLKRR